MGQVIFDLLNGRNIRLYPAADMREQALHRCDREPAGFRIAKEKTTSKIDSIVALAMACVAAIERGKVDLGTLTEFNKPKPIVVNQRFDARDPDSYLKNYR